MIWLSRSLTYPVTLGARAEFVLISPLQALETSLDFSISQSTNMIKLNTPIACATAEKGSVAIDWQKVLSVVSTKVVMFNFQKNFLLSDNDAEDVIQDSCMKIFLHKDEFDSSKSKLSTWISKIAVNCYFDALREVQKRKTLFEPISSNIGKGNSDVMEFLQDSPDYCTDSEVMAAELEGLLTLALEPLCDTYRKVIRCIVEGVPQKEMLEHLHCSKKNLRPTISRARKAARNSFVALGIL